MCIAWIALLTGIGTGCSSPGYESIGTTPNALLLASLIDSLNGSLSGMNCTAAITTILPFYNSTNTNNQIRLATAASYGCLAGVQVLPILNNLVASSSSMNGSGFWEFMAAQFPSVTTPVDDKVPYYAEYGVDAAMSVLREGNTVLSSVSINSDSNNPGSLLYSDRLGDANSYLTFLSMAIIGSLENRNARPSANHHKGVALPWVTAVSTPGDGCSMASAVLNYYDGLTYLSANAPAALSTVYGEIQSLLNTGLSLACQQGCFLCGMSCSGCPTSLRDRNACQGLASDVNSCAAAGIIMFINSSWTGPP